MLSVPVAGRRKYYSVCNKMLPPEETDGTPAHILLVKISHYDVAGHDQLQKGEEVPFYHVPGLRRRNSQRTAFPGNGKGRRDSRER